jgi:hypothetical protein
MKVTYCFNTTLKGVFVRSCCFHSVLSVVICVQAVCKLHCPRYMCICLKYKYFSYIYSRTEINNYYLTYGLESKIGSCRTGLAWFESG